MKFCKNCGEEIRPEAKVCTNCGHKVEASATNTAQRQQPEPSKPMDPAKKKLLIIFAAGFAMVAVIIAIVYSLVAGALSPDNKLDTIAEAVTEEDAEALKKAVDNDITLEEAQAYIAYVDQVSGLSKYNSWVGDVKTALGDGAPGSDIFDGIYTLLSVNKDGSQYLVFDDYSFTIPRTNVYMSEAYDMDKFVYTMDGNDYEWTSGSEKFAELIPGKYQFDGFAVIDEKEYDSSINVDFQNSESAVLDPGYFYLTISESVTSMYYEDVSEDSLIVTVGGEEVEVNTNDYSDRLGPYPFEEELDVSATVTHAGETFESKNEPLNLSYDEVGMDYSTGEAAPVHFVELEFDTDAIYDAGEAERNAAQLEEEREAFEDDMEDHVESFLTDYLYALEMMYMFEDIDQVEDYVNDETDAYAALESNIDSGTFEGMYITDIQYSDFSRDGSTITVNVSSERDYDLLDEPAEIITKYTLEYDPEELDFEITGFQDV